MFSESIHLIFKVTTQLYDFIMPPKLTKTSRPVKMLISMLQDGTLSGEETAKEVQETNDIFKNYNINTFRTRWNALRKQYGPSKGKFTVTANLYTLYGSNCL